MDPSQAQQQPVVVADRDSTTESSGLPPWVKLTVVMVMLGGAVALLLFGSQASDAFVYSKLVHEVLGSPEQFACRELRVEGDLKQGSIQFREKPCEWRFVIKKEGHELPVRFPQCIVPDTFKDGMGIVVTVQGKLQPDNSFLANQVIPRCPSKYEMEQRMQSGEQMPHAPPDQMPSVMPELPADMGG
jgi:cytochrome c-type biogenesis protein CcmE